MREKMGIDAHASINVMLEIELKDPLVKIKSLQK